MYTWPRQHLGLFKHAGWYRWLRRVAQVIYKYAANWWCVYGNNTVCLDEEFAEVCSAGLKVSCGRRKEEE